MTLSLIVSGGGGLLSGLSSLGNTQQERMLEELAQEIKSFYGGLSSVGLSEQELTSRSDRVGREFITSADLAGASIGRNLGETGSDLTGQNFNEYYASTLAPIKAQGFQLAAQEKSKDTDRIINQDLARTQAQLSTLGLLSNVTTQAKRTTGLQDFFTSFLQGTNIFATGYGNLAKAYKDFSYEPVTTGGNP